MKECPPKDYCQLIEIIESYVDQQIDKYNKKIIVLVGSGRAQMEMHSDDLYVCLDIDKCALYCAKFAMKYLFRKKSNVIVQHYNIKEGLSFLLHKIHRHIPSSVEMVVLFQHPSPRNDPVVRDVLIQGAMNCCKICIKKIMSSIHFVYDWHTNKNCGERNKLKTLIMHEISWSQLLELHFTKDTSISIGNTSLVDHPIQGIVPHRGWALMKKGDKRSFSVYKNTY